MLALLREGSGEHDGERRFFARDCHIVIFFKCAVTRWEVSATDGDT